MKSWISFLMPDDEYKRIKLLYYYAEGAVLLVVCLFVLIFVHEIFLLELTTTHVLLLSIGVFIFYTALRYTWSGMEYDDVMTKRRFNKERNVIFIRGTAFPLIFLTVYLLIIEKPTDRDEWINLVGLIVGMTVIWNLSSYISLKRSYKKNKELV
ncbi:hypothetical protein [Bacillus sp. JCM 19034]|uniref:hypothetical protein n=1 Tax=Bacillus sp. JCM 19034 TaxID=1481928 RepID=UPI0007834B86|nr:hypothetical protein [Bacillus sp. JCM 19034]